MGASILLGAGGGLAACGSSSSPSGSTSSSTPAGAVKRGGTLTAALTGGDSSDTLDGQNGVDNVDFARIVSLYNGLVEFDDNCNTNFVLAENIVPNADASTWTIELRKGVTFHNGKDLTAEDVIFSLQRVTNPKAPLPAASSLALVDTAHLKAVDNYTVKVPCLKPYATFVEAILGYYYYLSIVPVGYDPKNPVGTGPFKYKSFSPGVTSTFVRNENYFEPGLPYVDTLVIDDYADETSQVNALISGAADVVNLLSATSIAAVRSGGAHVLVSDAGGFTPFTMRVDLDPYSNVNLRKALRLCVNRPQMIEHVFAGYGTIGNDIFSPYDPSYDKAIPQRTQDIDQAKFYLRQAGLENISLTLATADLAQGTLLAAQVLQEQAALAGIKISLDQVTVTQFYGSNYLKWAFGQDYWYYSEYLPQVAQATLPTSPFNETHWSDPHYVNLYNQAISTTNEALRKEIAQEMQMIDWNDGGYIIPYFPPVIDGYTSKVNGAVPCKTGLSLSNYGFDHFWLD